MRMAEVSLFINLLTNNEFYWKASSMNLSVRVASYLSYYNLTQEFQFLFHNCREFLAKNYEVVINAIKNDYNRYVPNDKRGLLMYI